MTAAAENPLTTPTFENQKDFCPPVAATPSAASTCKVSSEAGEAKPVERRFRAIYTCTPVAFHANRGFHIRDTGLIARHLRLLGFESKCIMPLPYYDDDTERDNLIRVEMEKLRDPEWWRSLGIDGVVLYSWAAPRYGAIARAIRRAGLWLSIHLDTSGNFWGDAWETAGLFKKLELCWRMPVTDFLRARHLRCADVITTSPPVQEILRHHYLYGAAIADKVQIMPCPVARECAYDGTPKEPLILFIGRWDDPEPKRPEYMMAALDELFGPLAAELPAGTKVDICGTLTPELRAWHAALPESARTAITLVGYVDNALLPTYYNRASVLACPSRHESTHIVSAEALCCGASVVVSPRSRELPVVCWYTTRESGRIAKQDTPRSFAEAIRDELLVWQKGQRNPRHIASSWQPVFHADLAMARILHLPAPRVVSSSFPLPAGESSEK